MSTATDPEGLDDFFARRDKSKQKKSKSYTTPLSNNNYNNNNNNNNNNTNTNNNNNASNSYTNAQANNNSSQSNTAAQSTATTPSASASSTTASSTTTNNTDSTSASSSLLPTSSETDLLSTPNMSFSSSLVADDADWIDPSKELRPKHTTGLKLKSLIISDSSKFNSPASPSDDYYSSSASSLSSSSSPSPGPNSNDEDFRPKAPAKEESVWGAKSTNTESKLNSHYFPSLSVTGHSVPNAPGYKSFETVQSSKSYKGGDTLIEKKKDVKLDNKYAGLSQ